MDLDIVFLGTSGSMPTAKRAPAATLIRRGGERLLFDCAEGTQRQLLRSGIGLIELREIFLTHYHADHFLGLPGMLKTFSLRGRVVPLTVYGPPGLVTLFKTLRRIFGALNYEVKLVEVTPGDALEREDYRLIAFPVSHGISAIGYALAEEPRPGRFDVEAADALGVPAGQERGLLQRGESVTLDDGKVVTPDEVLGPPRPGRKIVLSGDTQPVASVLEIAQDAELLVHDATFGDEEEERARETAHTTARQAAQIAAAANVRMLALTHLSNRYFGPELAREAQEVFSETIVPKDFDTIEVRFQERGGPIHHKAGALETRREAAPEPETVGVEEGA